MSAANRNYKATVILDTRGYDEPVETLLEKMKTILKDLGAEIKEASSHGRLDFVRVTEPNHTGDTFLDLVFSAPANVPNDLQEKIRLNKTIKRVLVQSA